MILNARNVDGLRRLAARGSDVQGKLNELSGFTLPGTMEALASVVSSASNEVLSRAIVKHVQNTRQSPLALAFQNWNADSGYLGQDIHGTRKLEFYRLRTRADQTDIRYSLYQERFVRSLQRLGNFNARFAKALAGVLAEMTDNVIQHSKARATDEFTGLAGYQVSDGYMCFAVIDVGQGVLTSLKKAPAWAHLQAAEEALHAVVYEHASSRPGEPHGDGFRTLFRNLTDRNCRLRFRTDDAAFAMISLGNDRQGTSEASPLMPGLQLSVCCCLKGELEEKEIDFD